MDRLLASVVRFLRYPGDIGTNRRWRALYSKINSPRATDGRLQRALYESTARERATSGIPDIEIGMDRKPGAPPCQ